MVTVSDVVAAQFDLKGHIQHTPLVYNTYLSELTNCEVYLKLENLQYTGSFKLRGAMYKILSSLDKIGPGGVVTASIGNHSQGTAFAATKAGIPSTIVMPEWAFVEKQRATEGYGGKVILKGKSLGESLEIALKLSKTGMMFIHPANDPKIIAGQGTIGLEILDCVEPDFILAPIGGGGLISGMLVVMKEMRLKTKVKVVGIQTSAFPSSFQSCKEGKPVKIEPKKTIADGIAVKQPGDLTFSIINKFVDEIVLVEEDQIESAILTLLEHAKVLVEGAGAVPVAALVNRLVSIPRGSKVVLIISGGNIGLDLLNTLLTYGTVEV